MELYLKGKIKDGELVILNKDNLHSFFLKNEGVSFELIIKPYKKMISLGQMRWYRGIAINHIIEGVKEKTGEILDHDTVHAYNISKIMKPKITTKEVLGETIVETKAFSMKDMTKDQFQWFKTELQLLWAEKDIDIPDPNEENFLNGDNSTGIGSIKDFHKNSSPKN